MKNGIRRWLTLAIVPVATIMMLGVVTPAQADHGEPPTHKCDGAPLDPNNPFLLDLPTGSTEQNPFNGRIIVVRDGNCNVNVSNLYATLEIEFRVTNGDLTITSQNLSSRDQFVELVTTTGDIDAQNTNILAGTHIELIAGESGTQTGKILTKDITANTLNSAFSNRNILIKAQDTVMLGDIKTTGTMGVNSNRSGAVQIDANLHANNNGDIVIGGANINSIDVRSVFGGELNPFRVRTGARITNGTENSTGNITLTSGDAIKVTHSQSRSGWIELNAQKGELIINGGTIDVSGTTGGLGGANMGGNVYLFAEKITFSSDMTINASSADGAPDSARQIILAATTIDYSGTSKLEVLNDGNGISSLQPATIYFLPQGGMVPNSTDVVEELLWTFSFNGGFFFLDKPLNFDGGSAADLLIRGDGDGVQIAITGHPITFSGKDVQIQTKGDHNVAKHEIVMGYFGAPTGVVGINFGNTGTAELFVRGEGNGAAGGDIQIQTPDNLIAAAAKLNLKANGPQGKEGDGGTITVLAPLFAAPNTIVKLIADASATQKGDAQLSRFSGFERKAISFDAGISLVELGKGIGRVQMSANGGGGGGDGGAIQVTSQTIDVLSTLSVEASAGPTGKGKGGKIELSTLNTTSPPNIAFRAKGNGKGEGGEFKITSLSQTLDITHAVVVKGGGGLTVNNGKMGSIELNGIKCQAYKIRPGNTYPKRYWKCFEPEIPVFVGDAVLDLLLNIPAKDNIEARETEVFFMGSGADINTFHIVPAPSSGLGGFTFETDLNNQSEKHVYVNIFLDFQPPLNSTVVKGVAAHEFGHAIDFFHNEEAQNNSTFKQWVNADLNDLNFISAGVPRPACAPFGSEPAPFLGVQAQISGVNEICIEDPNFPGVFNLDPMFVDPNTGPFLNSVILKLAMGNSDVFVAPEWDEPYAQAFGYSAFDNTIVPITATILFTYNGVANNGYLDCQIAWAQARHDNQAVPPSLPVGRTCTELTSP